MATTEGTLLASYSRGMRASVPPAGEDHSGQALHAAGPVFFFEDALQAREFGVWLVREFEAIKAASETTTRSGKLCEIEQYPVANMLYPVSATPPAMPPGRT